MQQPSNSQHLSLAHVERAGLLTLALEPESVGLGKVNFTCERKKFSSLPATLLRERIPMAVSRRVIGVFTFQKMTNLAVRPVPACHLRVRESRMIFLAHSCGISHISTFLASVGLPFCYKFCPILLPILSQDFNLFILGICTSLNVSRAP